MKTNKSMPAMAVLLVAGLSLAAKGCPPQIDSIDPDGSEVGEVVNIMGAHFGRTQDASTVTFNGADAGSAVAWGDKEIEIAVPGDATSGPVVVTVEGQASGGYGFLVYADCETFEGGAFQLDISAADDTCLTGLYSDLFEQAVMEIDMSGADPVEIPPTADLPIELDFEMPVGGVMTFVLDQGAEHCWDGSIAEPHDPFVIDLYELTEGQFDCTISIEDIVFQLDPLAGGEIVIRMGLQVDTIEGPDCPANNAPGCTIGLRMRGELSAP